MTSTTSIPVTLAALLSVASLPCALACGIDPAPSSFGCAVHSEEDLRELADRRDLSVCIVEIYETELTTLDALEGASTAGAFAMVSNRNLTDIDVLESFVSIDSLFIDRSPLADDVVLTQVTEDITLFGSSAVCVAGEQSRLETLHLKDHPQLTTVRFPTLRSADTIILEGLPFLSELDLSSMTSLRELTVRETGVHAADIDVLAAQAGLAPGAVFHCGNVDDPPC